ncbi:hypothetical protein DM01DRAFT_1027381 [Hesseltinella vesiculosa]|uniref:Alginate lyase domain-containing protein n=1 Tax=Hesseltinella vesiculosa TaxID=101127 RepID=A0A1X2GKU1_9FUNG|nr:hypothetical protein DM01DRAFT_1027381 [Hesseltinella vesiculosa]
MQRMALHLFLDENDKAKEIVASIKDRMGIQIQPDGQQPFETARPFSWFYSVFNVRGLFNVCHMSQKLTSGDPGMDLCHYTRTNETKPAMRIALDYLLPFAMKEDSWPFRNVGGFNGSKYLTHVLEDAFIHYGDPWYVEVNDNVGVRHAQKYNITRLLKPWSILGDHSPQAARGFGPQTDAAHSLLSSPPLWLTIASVLVALLTSHSLIS